MLLLILLTFKKIKTVNYFYLIYCLSNQLNVYNLKLELVILIEQTYYPNDPFYFPTDIIQLEAKNGKYFWLNPSGLNILNEQTGVLIKKIEIKADKQPIGLTEYAQPFTTHTIQLNSNDMFFLFTDGFADQFGGEKGKKFKYNNLEKLLLANKNLPMKEQNLGLDQAFEQWRGNLEQIDDVCVLGVRL